jgi:hypothetical protein
VRVSTTEDINKVTLDYEGLTSMTDDPVGASLGKTGVDGNYKMKISEEDIVITEWYASEVVDRKEVKFNGSPADWKTGDYSPPSTFFNRGD